MTPQARHALMSRANGSEMAELFLLDRPPPLRHSPGMTESPNIAALAAPLADPVRARMICLMMDGRARTVTELGAATGLAKASASEQVSTLVDAGFLRAERQGRHKYLTLASPDVARLVEAMMALAGQLADPCPSRPQRLGPRDPALRQARLCYNHLAGALGVRVYQSLSARSFLAHTSGGLDLTFAGRAFCQDFGLPDADLAPGPARSPLCRDCLDWSERQSHLGGRLGRLLLARMEARDWLRRRDGTRALTLTPKGRTGMGQAFPLP
jgi:DNA-binding transcriptional ArsR family regulator